MFGLGFLNSLGSVSIAGGSIPVGALTNDSGSQVLTNDSGSQILTAA